MIQKTQRVEVEESYSAQIEEVEVNLWVKKGGICIPTPVLCPVAQKGDTQHYSRATLTWATRWVGEGWAPQRGRDLWISRINAMLQFLLKHHPLPHIWMWQHCLRVPGSLSKITVLQGCPSPHPKWAGNLPYPHPNTESLQGTCSSSSRRTISSADRGESFFF